MSDPTAPTGEIDPADPPRGPAPWQSPRVPRREADRVALGFKTSETSLFWLALKTAALAIVTLGIYRFWMVAQLRGRYWGAIAIDGDPLEYTGTGTEKFLGFLLAILVLAVYIGAVNLALAFAGLSYFSDDPIAQSAVVNVSILAVLPLVFYATYRSQGYMLARSRWRGIRFGLEPGAWAYTGRACLLTLLTVCTLGLAYPYQHWKTAQFITDRARYGDLAFRQEGSWRALMPVWLPIYFVAAGIVALAVVTAADPSPGTIYFGALGMVFGLAIVILLYQRYRVAAFRILWSNRRLGAARFRNSVSPGRVVGIYIGGGIATSFCATLVGLAALAILGFGASAAGLLGDIEPIFDGTDPDAALARSTPYVVVGAAAYLVFFAAAFAFSQVFVTRPVLGAQVEAMTIEDASVLSESRQRPHDRAAEAGGFADALGVDLGAGL